MSEYYNDLSLLGITDRKQLERKGIHDITELLFFLPRKYKIYGKPGPVREGETAILLDLEYVNLKKAKSGMELLIASGKSDGKKVSVMWFHQGFKYESIYAFDIPTVKEAYLCKECATKSKADSVLRERTCKICGASFMGYLRSFFCLECSSRRKSNKRKNITNGNHHGLWGVRISVKHAESRILFIRGSKDIARNAQKKRLLTISGHINGNIWQKIRIRPRI